MDDKPTDVDFTKMTKTSLHPTDSRGQYISPKKSSKRQRNQ